MQTFLPLSDLVLSLKCLDNKRLSKQRVEAYQIILVLERRKTNPKVAWGNHPAVLMWKGYEHCLTHYMNIAILEHVNRGFHNNMEYFDIPPDFEYPPWFGAHEFHASHRSNLLRKNSDHYSQFGWSEPDNLPYVWPTKNFSKYYG